MKIMLARLSIAIAFGACMWAQTFIESSRADLVKAVPELSAIEFDSDQSKLEPLQRAAGTALDEMLGGLIDVSMAEDVHEMRYSTAQMLWRDHLDKVVYLAQSVPMVESRRPGPEPNTGFLVAGRFLNMLDDFQLENYIQSKFRYLGRLNGAAIIAYSTVDGSRQGLVWIDEATKRITRFRTDFLKMPAGEPLQSFSRDLSLIHI